MERIIYVVPFTSITEQISDVFRDVVKDDSVLEHHMRKDDSSKTSKCWITYNFSSIVIVLDFKLGVTSPMLYLSYCQIDDTRLHSENTVFNAIMIKLNYL